MGKPEWEWFSNPIWEQIRECQDVFAGVFAYGRWRFNSPQATVRVHRTIVGRVAGDAGHALPASIRDRSCRLGGRIVGQDDFLVWMERLVNHLAERGGLA